MDIKELLRQASGIDYSQYDDDAEDNAKYFDPEYQLELYRQCAESAIEDEEDK